MPEQIQVQVLQPKGSVTIECRSFACNQQTGYLFVEDGEGKTVAIFPPGAWVGCRKIS